MLEMIGVGPFITIPVLLAKMNGPQAMLGWLLGALVALSDGMVWAELGAAMPGTGGPYRYLSEAYGPKTVGRMMSFLFVWETVLLAPLSIAGGAVGFAQYARFLFKDMGWLEEKLIAVAALYLTMNVTIIGVVPWREAIHSTAIVSDFIERLHGPLAAKIVTVLILWTTFGSIFAALLGYSRVPYAAAIEGRFFRPFAR